MEAVENKKKERFSFVGYRFISASAWQRRRRATCLADVFVDRRLTISHSATNISTDIRRSISLDLSSDLIDFSLMSSSISLEIPAGKLGTVRIDRTVDVYSTNISSDPTFWNVQTCEEKILSDDNDELDDIAVIYSLVRRASTRRASSPRIPVLPLPLTNDNSAAQTVKSYTLEPPLPAPMNRISCSNSFSHHDRPSVPLITVKPRPYSFRSPRRSLIERQISQITERVSQLQETFLSRLTNAPNRQRNRSLSTFNASVIPLRSNEYSIKRRPKSETFDDHYRVNSGRFSR